jgi:CspA family cold shock protein
MQTGTIKRLTEKGFGFIAQEGADKDVFFHASALVNADYNDLREGDNVQFDVEQNDKGLTAINVERV